MTEADRQRWLDRFGLDEIQALAAAISLSFPEVNVLLLDLLDRSLQRQPVGR